MKALFILLGVLTALVLGVPAQAAALTTLPEASAASADGDSSYALGALERLVTTHTDLEALHQVPAEQWEQADDVVSGVAPDVTQKPNTTLRVGRWFVLGGAFLVLLVFVTFRGRALLGWRRRNRRTSRLEESTAAAIHKNLADQATSDVLAFGSAIEAERINEHDVLALWNLALDDYDQASRLFDDRRGPLDDRKIIEICARGMDRLAKAQR